MLTLPNIWTPTRRRIVRPSIPAHWRRGPHHRPHCPLHVMADGDESIDANGDQLIDANGDEYIMCCCIRYVQARKCSDNSDVDLWILDTGISYGFLRSSVNYYVDCFCNRSSTPGTIITVATTATNCPQCNPISIFPRPYTSYLAVFSGVIICACLNQFATDYATTGVLNGSYIIPASPLGGGCQVVLSTSVITTTKGFATPACSGSASSSFNMNIFSSNSTSSIFVQGTTGVFYSSVYPSTGTSGCSVTLTNQFTSCGQSLPGVPVSTGYGGQVVLTPIP